MPNDVKHPEDQPTPTPQLERQREQLRAQLARLDDVNFREFGSLTRRLKRLRVETRKKIASLTQRIRKRKVRIKPSVVYTKTSPNQSARTSGIRLIVIHDTESHEQQGNGDLVSIADYFAQSAAQASAHVITDGDGHSARCVSDDRKAWHCAAFNSAALGIEQIGYATYTRDQWKDAQVDETARWVALWSKLHGVPIQRGAVNGSTVVTPGVVTHAQLGAAGGGHHDPGTNYPMDHLLERAAYFKSLL